MSVPAGPQAVTATSRHLTRLAELGLPVHVLQRYAGHANPTMSMHYVGQREEHAEQAFPGDPQVQS
jgi:integrase